MPMTREQALEIAKKLDMDSVTRRSRLADLLLSIDAKSRAEAIAEAGWRCFHCGVTFTDEKLASEHFGRDRENPRPTACEGMLIAYAETFERYGVHRNFHNAASVKILIDQVTAETARECAEIVNELARSGMERPLPLDVCFGCAAIIDSELRTAFPEVTKP